MDDDATAVRDAWDGVAGAWERYEDELAAFSSPIRDALLAHLEAGPEDVVLELAAGTGGLSRVLADRVREVVCTDVARGMVEAAARRADEAGLGNVRCEVVDAHDLPFEQGSVDRVVCQMGLMLMPDPAAVLDECRRVLRTGGRLAVATWGLPQDNLWIVMVGGSLLQRGHGLPGDPTEPGGLFSLAGPAALEERLAAGGFSGITVESVELEASFDRFEDYWDRHVATAGPLRAIIAGLPPEELDAARETCRDNCAAFATDDGYRFTGRGLVASAEA